MKLSSRSTNDLNEFLLNEPKMSRSTCSDGVPNLATIDGRQEMPVHIEPTTDTIHRRKGTSNKFARKVLPRPRHLRLSSASLIKYITTSLHAAGLKTIDGVCSLFIAVVSTLLVSCHPV